MYTVTPTVCTIDGLGDVYGHNYHMEHASMCRIIYAVQLYHISCVKQQVPNLLCVTAYIFCPTLMLSNATILQSYSSTGIVAF